MGKTTKTGEYSNWNPTNKKRERRKRKTRQEKELIIKTYEEIIDDGHHRLQPMMYPETSKRERARQERLISNDTIPDSIITKCNHKESIVDTDGSLVCRFCGIRVEKKKGRKEIFIDLFCTHKETVEKNGFLICTTCDKKIMEIKIKN